MSLPLHELQVALGESAQSIIDRMRASVDKYDVSVADILKRRSEQGQWRQYKKYLENSQGSIDSGNASVPKHLSTLHNNKQLLRLAVALEVTPLKGCFLSLSLSLSLIFACFSQWQGWILSTSFCFSNLRTNS